MLIFTSPLVVMTLQYPPAMSEAGKRMLPLTVSE